MPGSKGSKARRTASRSPAAPPAGPKAVPAAAGSDEAHGSSEPPPGQGWLHWFLSTHLLGLVTLGLSVFQLNKFTGIYTNMQV
jgi:hypothetical protein